jgi:hypothetical protein
MSLKCINTTTFSEVTPRESLPVVDLKTTGYDPLSKCWIISTSYDDIIAKDVDITSERFQLLD